MHRSSDREALFRQINRFFYPVYLLASAACILVYALRADAYHLGIALGTLLIPLLPELFYRIFRLRRVYQLDFFVLAFSLLGYTLGAVVDLYQRVPFFDKAVHMLSGVFVSMLLLCLFCAVCPSHAPGRSERLLAVLFVFFGSMAVAGLWEICEYAVHALTGRDVQQVLSTGVDDTMQDMIVCLIGTLLYLPQVLRLCKGETTLLNGMAQAFVEKNAAVLERLC